MTSTESTHSFGTSAMAPELARQIGALFASDSVAMADPYAVWNELRDTHPTTRLGGNVIVSKHADVKALLGDNNMLYSRQRTRDAAMYVAAKSSFTDREADAFENVLGHEFRQLVRLDPPDHPRQRHTVRPPFTPRALANEMEAKIADRIAEGLAAADAEGGIIDWKKFSYTLPFQVIGDLLGISLTDLDIVHGWARSIADNKFNADTGALAIEAEVAYDNLIAYIDRMIERQHATGTPTGLVAALIEAGETGHIAPEEASALLALMVFAGHETTSGLLSVGFLELLRHPEQWAAFRADPSLAPKVVEELLRFVTPVQFLPYTIVGDREINGLPVRDGETVIGVLAAANRDPEVFTLPDELDILRPDSSNHLGFGLGPHFCLGAGLARMEATHLFRALAEQFPDAELVADPPAWGGRALRTPLHLPIRLNDRRG